MPIRMAIYESGIGKIKIRGKIEIEKGKGGKDRMVITEIPYTMIGANIGKFLNDIYGLVESKATSDITDITNQSSKEGIRIVLELKKGADIEALENLLYKKTKLEDTFGARNIADISQRPHYGTGESKAEYSRNNNYNSRYKPDYKAGKAYLRINVLE